MKYLKIIKEDGSYKFYEDDAIETNTNLIKTESLASYNPYLFKGVKYFRNSKTYESNKKDLSEESVYSNSYISNDNVPQRYIKELNGKLFAVSRNTTTSSSIYNITDDVTISGYTDLTYYNGLYYLVKNTKEVYTSTDLITFTLYKTYTSPINFGLITNIGSQLFFVKTGNITYAEIAVHKANEDDTTTRIANNITDTMLRQNYLYSYDNYIIVLTDDRVGVIDYDTELGTFNFYTSDAYNYPRNISIDVINNKLLVAQKSKIIEFDFNTKTFSYYTMTNNGAIYLYHAIKLNDTGNNYSISNNGTVKNGVIYEELNTSYNITITANTNYVIDSVTSTNGTVNVIDDFTVQVVYSGDNLYEEDTLEIETSYALALEPKNYRLKETYNLTETFESIDTALDNFAIVEDNGLNKIIPFKAIRFTDTLELKVNDTWTSFDEILYLSISENIFGITNEFLTIFNGTFDYYYKGITSEYTTNLENLNITLSGYNADLVHIDYDLESDSEVNFYVAFMDNSSKLFFNINVDEGYKIVSLDTNVGTYTTIYNPRVEVTQAEMVQNLNAQFNILLDADDIEIILYKNTSDVNKKNKNLTSPLSLTCNMTEATSVESPSIIIESTLLPPDYNYCYIPKFKRYYFIVNRINVGFKLWRIVLEVDTLKTASTKLDNMTAYVLRSSSNYDEKLEDEMLPKYSKRTFTELTCTNYKTFNFNTSFTWHYLVVLRDIASFTKTSNDNRSITYNAPYITNGVKKDVNGVYTNLAHSTAGDDTDLIVIVSNYNNLIDYINSNSLQSHLKYVMALPESAVDLFDLYNIDTTTVVDIKFDDSHTYSRTNIKVANSYPRKVLYTTCDLSGRTKELYRDDYKINVYLPFFGMTDIDKNKVSDSLDIYYYLDLTNGVANVSVESGNHVILAQQCNLGIKIGIDENNENEINKQREMIQTQQTSNNITSAITMIGSIASLIAGGVMSATGVGAGLGAGAIIGGIAGLGASTSALVSKNVVSEKQANNLYVSASSILGTGNSSLYLPNTVKVYINAPEIVLSNTGTGSDYLNRFGKPLKQFVKISTLSGFVQVGDIDLSGLDLTLSEIQKLREILYKGFYM